MSLPNFDALRHMHESANNMLHSPITKAKIVHHKQEKWAYEISEASLKMVDTCSATKDILLLAKEHLQNLQSILRRVSINKESAGLGSHLAPYHLPRKKLKKAMLKRLQSLKGIKNKCITSGLPSTDHSLLVVVDVLKGVRSTTASIVQSLMSLISMPNPHKKSNKQPFHLKLRRVNSLRYWEKCDSSTMEFAAKKLEAVEIVIEELEAELECMFRRLIRTRASLLNILTN